MCQLLGMNAAAPTAFSFCFSGFCRRGGGTDVHKDGWGMALYEGRGLRSFLDVQACAKSPVAKFVSSYPTKSQNMVAHIRCATHGRVGLENVHPFSRELWGIPFCFAHNGDSPSFTHQRVGHHVLLGKATEDNLAFHAIGDTDSEALFCAILNAVRAEFHYRPTLRMLYDAIQRFVDELVQRESEEQEGELGETKFVTICNFLLGCGPNVLICYSYPGKREGSTVWNGLHYILQNASNVSTTTITSSPIVDEGKYALNFNVQGQQEDDGQQRKQQQEMQERQQHQVAIIATKLLSRDQGWIEMQPNELIMIVRGCPYKVAADLDALERKGLGLSTNCIEDSRRPFC